METVSLSIRRRSPESRVIALAGNPNVGKSTVFNALTGLHQHTGNWPGKTVTNAQGSCTFHGREYILADLPGCYSLLSHSAEEEAARDFICFGESDGAVIVCDATCLERNLILALQVLEITGKAVLCVNLLDEARRKGIGVDLEELSLLLGIPVTGAAARSGQGLDDLLSAVEQVAVGGVERSADYPPVTYPAPIEAAIAKLLPAATALCGQRLSPRWLAVRMLSGGDDSLQSQVRAYLGVTPGHYPPLKSALKGALEELAAAGYTQSQVQDEVAAAIVQQAERIARATVQAADDGYSPRDPILLLMLLGIFWLTIVGANAPSRLLSDGLFWLGGKLKALCAAAGAPQWLTGLLTDGVYKTLAWVVSVMLPPMAIFFPLFTLLEDLGYLPRVAFNLDRCFQKCGACGKQALTTAMGFGCNAVGVTGCAIIDSPRERLIAAVTNSFVPCNGRLPMLISLISMFFVGTAVGFGSSVLSAAALLALILLGIAMTFLTARVLSATLLKGTPSSFALELPPYRRPQIGKVILRSVLDRTLFVLGRAAAVAAPAGLVIWLMANLRVGGATVLAHCCGFLDPFARLFGLDGVILLAFLLGWPANEIVVPIIIMAYTAQGSLVEMTDLNALRTLLTQNGWTWVTALCTMLFSLMHWPCSTTCLTLYKETKSLKWTALGILLPTLCGLALCFLTATAARLLGF